jgi:hypothetical protein
MMDVLKVILFCSWGWSTRCARFPIYPTYKIKSHFCIALHCIKKRGRILDVYFNFCGKNQVASLVLTFVY